MARRRARLPALIGGAVFLASAVLLIGGLWGFGATTRAPETPGVCHRMLPGPDGKPRFVALAKDVLNLETCAAHLERIFLQVGGRVDGAYQGRFIFIDEEAVRSAASLEGSRWRVFFEPQRADLDKKLREGGRAPSVVLTPAR